ncbi:endonuclease domain-containing protein [Agrococcus sp. HG114]|uniref:endonuclease domain-containing protein n=1 Tax=Agrococcus sp. HG114 TaxID=2969757 RepID=UPI00215A7A07|nr:endonuclease domain-containing protein [Agrococcus sp. HG114]MCR8671822.1 endonuclease domain-containing protein [Agrococcus sp. HG114]
MELLEWMRATGGLCTMQAARDRASKDEIDSMRGSALWSPLRGWLALVGMRDERTWALQHGGVATCVTSFAKHGMWVPHGPQHVHVRVNRETNSDRVRAAASTPGIALHRMHLRLPDQRPVFGLDTPIAALAVASGCVAPDELVAAADSALGAGLVQLDDVRRLAAVLPRRRRRALERASSLSGSGTESVFAAMLRRAGVAFVQQPELLPGQFVDFLIGTSLVVEIDSQRWHASPAQQASDRARDAALTALGYRVIRFTYEQITFERDASLAAVLRLVRRGMHRRAVRR